MAMCAAQEAARLQKTPQQDSVQPGFGRGQFVKFRPASRELNSDRSPKVAAKVG